MHIRQDWKCGLYSGIFMVERIPMMRPMRHCSYTSKRAKLEDQVVAAAVAAGVDGINLDFELISSKCGVHYVQLVRELSVKCHQNNLVFSVDNYVPQSYNSHYDLKEQGIVADYVVIMAYDEHTEGSYEAGSVASISYLQDGIEKTLKKVSADKVIAGIPFFTRLWFETAKSPEQLSEEAGTEAASYPNKVSSKALGMEEAAQSVVNAGATAQWEKRHSKTMQNGLRMAEPTVSGLKMLNHWKQS